MTASAHKTCSLKVKVLSLGIMLLYIFSLPFCSFSVSKMQEKSRDPRVPFHLFSAIDRQQPGNYSPYIFSQMMSFEAKNIYPRRQEYSTPKTILLGYFVESLSTQDPFSFLLFE